MLDWRTTARPKLMLPKNSTRQIPSSRICCWITLKSKGHKPSGPWFGSIGTCGLSDSRVCQAWWIYYLINSRSSNNIPHDGGGSRDEPWMNGPTWAPGISSSWVGGLSIAWTLPSNKWKPWGSLKTLVNIVELLNFLTCPLMKVTSTKTLWLSPIHHLGQ
jgi:hypothetical protein